LIFYGRLASGLSHLQSFLNSIWSTNWETFRTSQLITSYFWGCIVAFTFCTGNSYLNLGFSDGSTSFGHHLSQGWSKLYYTVTLCITSTKLTKMTNLWYFQYDWYSIAVSSLYNIIILFVYFIDETFTPR
jgi:hypothetical protein